MPEAYLVQAQELTIVKRYSICRPAEDENQESMVVVVKPDGDTYFWDGFDLRNAYFHNWLRPLPY